MLKKAYFLLLILLAANKMFGMSSYEDQTNNQINHIRAQMQVIQRAWKSERVRIKQAQKTAPALYQTLTTTIDKILASSAFTSRLETTVSNQVDSIVNNNMSFNSVKVEFNLSDFFSNLTMHDFGKKLFAAMANRACYLELGKRLAQKMQELKLAATNSTPQYSTVQY